MKVKWKELLPCWCSCTGKLSTSSAKVKLRKARKLSGSARDFFRRWRWSRLASWKMGVSAVNSCSICSEEDKVRPKKIDR